MREADHSPPSAEAKNTGTKIPHRRYLYFDVVVGLAWSNDSESYAGGSVATGSVSHAGQVKGDDPDEKG
jgi:hypothetical protein